MDEDFLSIKSLFLRGVAASGRRAGELADGAKSEALEIFERICVHTLDIGLQDLGCRYTARSLLDHKNILIHVRCFISTIPLRSRNQCGIFLREIEKLSKDDRR